MSTVGTPVGNTPAGIPLTARALLAVAKMLGLLVEAILVPPARPTPPERLGTNAGSVTRWLRDPRLEIEYVERWRDGELIDVEVHAT